MLQCYADGKSGATVLPPNDRVAIEHPLLISTMRNAAPYCSDENAPPTSINTLCRGMNGHARTVAIVPLLLDNYPMGALWTARLVPTAFTGADMIGMERLADQAVIAIQHGMMATQIQSLAVVGERGRIAREMHDGLAQILGYMNLQVQTLEALLKQGKQDSLYTELQQMREAIQTAHADVRENILSLRTTLATDAGVASAIAEYLDGFSVQTGIDVQFMNNTGEGLGLSPLAEVQLVCILQEALANVRKHARAETVTVTLARTNHSASLEIHDDGIGFSQPVAQHRFGLHTMSERAQSVGGHLTVRSEPGQGTLVYCELPEAEKGQSARETIPLLRVQEESEV